MYIYVTGYTNSSYYGNNGYWIRPELESDFLTCLDVVVHAFVRIVEETWRMLSRKIIGERSLH